jgi:hypothetical protein
MEMSDAFSSHNKSGLTAQSFSKYGDKLLVLAGVRLELEKKTKKEMKPKGNVMTLEMMFPSSNT